MMSIFRLPAVAAATLALVACSPSPRTDLAPPEPAGSAAQPAPSVDVGSGQATAAETAPGAQDAIVVKGPDGTVWVKPGEGGAHYRADVEDCYSYARAQVDNDARIESDAQAAFDSSARGFGLTGLRARMSDFERSRRRPALFSSCMLAKGYARR